jgi:DNA-directed RNA polymerase specialized sigma24 family protein
VGVRNPHQVQPRCHRNRCAPWRNSTKKVLFLLFTRTTRQLCSELPHNWTVVSALVHGDGFTLADAAESFGCSVSSLRNHLDRGMTSLRRELGVEP